MENKNPNDLSDGEIQELVDELSVNVRERQTEVDGLQTSLVKLRTGISDQQQVRQKYTEQLFKVEQAVPLLETNRQLRRELKEKQTLLKELRIGEAKEQRHIQELERRLAQLHGKEELDELNKENEQNTHVLKELESSYKQALAAYQSTKDELEKVQSEVGEIKRKQKSNCGPDSETVNTLPLDQQVDKMLLKYCKKAGLKLDLHSEHKLSMHAQNQH